MSTFPKLFEGHHEYLLQEVLESIDDAVVVFKQNLKIVYANKAAEDIFGGSAGTLHDQSFRQLMPKDKQQPFAATVTSLKDSKYRSLELTGKRGFEGIRANGHMFYAEGKLVRFKNESAYILILRDITWQKALEGELQTALAHLKTVGSKVAYRLEHPRIMDEFPVD